MPESTLPARPFRDGKQITSTRSIAVLSVLVAALVLPAVAFGGDAPVPGSVERTAAGGGGPRAPERGPFGPALIGQLVRLNDRLGLDTFPEDSSRWPERLVAAIEHRTASSSEAFPGSELLRRLAADLRILLVDQALADGSNAGAQPPGRTRAERLRRVLETVRLLNEKLDRLDRPYGARGRESSIGQFAAPLNDACASATVIGLGTVSGSTVEATIDGASSCDASNNRPDVWYRYTAAVDGLVTFTVSGTLYDTALSLHTGCPGDPGALELICSDDAGGTLQPEVTWDLAAANEVWVRVSGYGGSVGAFDLTVAPARGISGTVTRQDTGVPVAGAGVEVFDQFGDYLDETVTGADGSYALGGLDEGDYYVQVGKAGLISQLYDGISCPFWQICYPGYSGDSVHVGASGLTPGIDFALEAAGGLSGTVTDDSTGQGLQAYVTLHAATGEHLETYLTESDGTYAIDDLPPGTYFVVTEAMGYLTELYDDIPCPDACDPTTGTGVVVVGETMTSGIDSALSPLGTVTGTVTDATSATPLSGQPVVVYDDLGVASFPVYTATDGTYESAGLESGTYYVRTETSDYQDVLYDGIVCDPDCDETTGTPVQVSLATETSGIDFALTKLGVIAGTVLESGSGVPVIGEQVMAFDTGGVFAGSASTSADGSYEIRRLRAGTYRVKTATGTHQNELWDDIVCEPDCDVTTGNPVTVSLATTTSGIDFSLVRRGKITGTVTEAVGGLPAAIPWVEIYGLGGDWVENAFVAEGAYESSPLPSGTYYLVTDRSSSTYLPQLYDGMPCDDPCSVTAGTPVSVALETTTSGIDFALDRYGVVRGSVTAADTGDGFNLARITVLDEMGAAVRSDYAGAFGEFVVGSIPPGTYYVKASVAPQDGGDQYQDELYDDVPCEPDCDLAQGILIPVPVNSTVEGIDLVLTPCPGETNVDLAGTVLHLTETKEACELLTAGSNTIVSATGDVTFKAGRKIVLTDGFSVESGASFRAVIEPAWSPK